MTRVEEKLFQNRYRVDVGHAHVNIVNPSVCATMCSDKPCTFCCPAGCYTAEGDGRVTLITDGCMECGTCRILCNEFHNLNWEYPRGGYGVLFKFG